MNIVLSNALLNTDVDSFLAAAANSRVQQVELHVDRNFLLEHEGLTGDGKIKSLQKTLDQYGLSVYGFSLETDFGLDEDIMLAKKCINLLNKLAAQRLRLVPQALVTNPQDAELARPRIIEFLSSLGRFASYSAGHGPGETTVQIGVEFFRQSGISPEFVYSVIERIEAKNVGLGLHLQEQTARMESVLGEVNGHELTVASVSGSSHWPIDAVDRFLRQVVAVYDGPVVFELQSLIDSQVPALADCASQHEFDLATIDYSKMSYPSSVARIFRSFGTTSLHPSQPITAGCVGTWEYCYRVGPQGVHQGGGLKFGFHHSTDWERFQLVDPGRSGFVSVSIDGEVKHSIALLQQDAVEYIHVQVTSGSLRPGDTIRIIIGDGTNGSAGSQAQTFQQEAFSFYALVDATGYGHYFEHPDPPTVSIQGGVADKIVAVAPSILEPGQSFVVKVRVEDQYHNLAKKFDGSLRLELDGKSVASGWQETEPGVGVFTDLVLTEPGHYRLAIIGEGLFGWTNGIQVCTKPEHRVYWGDIHCHLSLMDSVGTIPEFYHYAQHISFLDFTCHSEHMDSFSTGRQGSHPSQWELIKQGVRAYHHPGEFVTLLGYENSEIWDANVYFPGDEAPWHVDSFAERLFAFAKAHGALVIPHMTTYPQRLRGYDWSNYDAAVIPVMEIYSGHGSSEYFGGERPLKNCEPGGYALDALGRGYTLGFIGSSDGHDCMPGNSPWGKYRGGLVAVLCQELTREAVFNAIRSRRCYATTGARIVASFSINGMGMGSCLSVVPGETLDIKGEFLGTADIAQADVIRDGVVIRSFKADNEDLSLAMEDQLPQTGHHYYYIRMKQVDEEMAWVSPIFVQVQ